MTTRSGPDGSHILKTDADPYTDLSEYRDAIRELGGDVDIDDENTIYVAMPCESHWSIPDTGLEGWCIDTVSRSSADGWDIDSDCENVIVSTWTRDVRGAQLLKEIAKATTEEGSLARAVDRIATETYGRGKSEWARATGRNPSSVSRNTN